MLVSPDANQLRYVIEANQTLLYLESYGLQADEVMMFITKLAPVE
jgi:hypothetical protein